MSATRRAVSPLLAKALRPSDSRCYRHCAEKVRPHRIGSLLPGLGLVYACPSGVVSVSSYVEWSRQDPSLRFQRYLAQHTVPAARVRRTDLRLATRHGPELGPTAERVLRRPGAPPLRVVYWRVYPFRARDGSERRLFVCLRRAHPGPVFYIASPTDGHERCPTCLARRKIRGPPRKR